MVNFSLEGKVALVTGAAYGIGFAMAKALAEAGAKIAFNCRSQANMDKAVADYKAEGIDAKGYICDATDEEGVKAMVADIEKTLGPVDILVNNAGIIKRVPMHEMPAEDFRQVIDIDLVAPYICAKAVLPSMMERRKGKIINICSMMSELGRETVSAYAALLRLLLCVNVRQTAAAILSIHSLWLRLLLHAGALRKTLWDRLSSLHQRLPTSSTATFSMWTEVFSHTSANSLSDFERENQIFSNHPVSSCSSEQLRQEFFC